MLHMAEKETSWLQSAGLLRVRVSPENRGSRLEARDSRVVLLFWYCCGIELVSSFRMLVLVRLVFIVTCVVLRSSLAYAQWITWNKCDVSGVVDTCCSLRDRTVKQIIL